MPESPSANLHHIKTEAEKIVADKGAMGKILSIEEPIAFGLKAVLVKGMFNMDNQDFDAIAEEIAKIAEVQSCEVAGMDLPLG